MNGNYDLLGLGCVAWDELLYVSAFPREGDKAAIQSQAVSCGGTTANALVAAARLGVRGAYAGTLGFDEDSQRVCQTLQAEGIDLSFVRREAGAQPIRCKVLIHARRATRTVLYDLAGAVPLAENWPPAEAIACAKVLLIDQFGADGMLRAARLAREHKIPVVADLERADQEGFRELLSAVDHLILPHELAAKITGCDDPAAAVARLWNDQREAIVVTCGEKGGWYHGNGMADGVTLHYPAPWVEAVDTTGCGDVFRGAYAASLISGEPLEGRLRLASAAAALKATRSGGQASFPTREELLRWNS